MGLLNRKKNGETILKQDLNQKDENNAVFIMHLFMKESCGMPDRERMTSVMKKHLGEAECFCHDAKSAGFAVKKYTVRYKDGDVPPMLMVSDCQPTDTDKIDALTRSQMWSCPDSERILSECRYQVIAIDMMAAGMEYKQRAEMLMDYMEALAELYPSMQAVFFQTSGKLFTREQILTHQISKEDRFVYFAVNVRFFNIQDSEDKLVDTLGMSILGLPDLQYHFHGLDPNAVVRHAYNLAGYLFDNSSPIEEGDSIDGLENGGISQNVSWTCHYEQSLIQPAREVIDIYMNEYAAGTRNED